MIGPVDLSATIPVSVQKVVFSGYVNGSFRNSGPAFGGVARSIDGLKQIIDTGQEKLH